MTDANTASDIKKLEDREHDLFKQLQQVRALGEAYPGEEHSAYARWNASFKRLSNALTKQPGFNEVPF